MISNDDKNTELPKKAGCASNFCPFPLGTESPRVLQSQRVVNFIMVKKNLAEDSTIFDDGESIILLMAN